MMDISDYIEDTKVYYAPMREYLKTMNRLHDGTSRSPIDSVAAIVISKGPNEDVRQFRQACRQGVFTTTIPLPMTSPPDTGAPDFTGHRQGFVTVIGYVGSRKVGRGHKRKLQNEHIWQVQCDCGRYETRRAVKLKKSQPNDQCLICNKKIKDAIHLWAAL